MIPLKGVAKEADEASRAQYAMVTIKAEEVFSDAIVDGYWE